jgi:insulysin
LDRSPAIVDRRVEGFLVALRQIVVDMPDEEFASHIAAVVTAKTEPDKRVGQDLGRAWGEICAKPVTLLFERRFLQAAAVKTLDKKEVLGFFDKWALSLPLATAPPRMC